MPAVGRLGLGLPPLNKPGLYQGSCDSGEAKHLAQMKRSPRAQRLPTMGQGPAVSPASGQGTPPLELAP